MAEDEVRMADYHDYPDLAAMEAYRLYEEGRDDEAIRLLDWTLENHTDKKVPFNIKGRVLHGCGRPDEALYCYERALEYSPGDPAILCNKAEALADLDRKSEALEAVERSLRSWTGNMPARRLRDIIINRR